MYSNHVIIGNLGHDPELRYLPSGVTVCSFSVAVNRKYTDRDGQTHDETTWYKVTTWGKLAETCSQYLVKGRQVLVEGDRLQARAYLNKQGEAAASLELSAKTVKFLGSRDSGETAPTSRADEAFIVHVDYRAPNKPASTRPVNRRMDVPNYEDGEAPSEIPW